MECNAMQWNIMVSLGEANIKLLVLRRAAEQPSPPPEDAMVLHDIMEGGHTLNRSTLLLRLLGLPATQVYLSSLHLVVFFQKSPSNQGCGSAFIFC